jgi:hypothetical protein
MAIKKQRSSKNTLRQLALRERFMDPTTISKTANATKTILGLNKKQHLILFTWLSSLSGAFYAGVEMEFRHTLSEITYPEYYEKLAATENAESYIALIKKNIQQWRDLQELPLDLQNSSQIAIELAQKLQNSQTQYMILIEPYEQNLPSQWRLWIEYFRIYDHFVCADREAKRNEKGLYKKDSIAKTSCMQKAIDGVTALSLKYSNNKFDKETIAYPEFEVIRANTKELKAFILALKFHITQNEGDKLAAKLALQNVGAETHLRERAYEHDRFLGPIFKLLYPSNAS